MLGAGLAGGIVAVACKSPAGSESGAATAEGCNTPFDDNSKNLRKTLQYKAKSDFPDKKCSLCLQFVAAQFGECGGCKLISGPVKPNGYCLSFATKDAPAPVQST